MAQAIVGIRNAVREQLQEYEAGDCILVAVSGGADSLALAYATHIEASALAIKAVAVTIDHQLQEKSTEQATRVEAQLKTMGFEKVIVAKVNVSLESGLEAGARNARYEALVKIATEENAVRVFLGHTRDDQAETVLLGLARGSGTRSLSGMAIENGIYVRPLLSSTREETENACKEMNLEFWNDPHNENPEFSRVRVRRDVLPIMEAKIGPGIAIALARSAALLRDDADALDALAAAEASRHDLKNFDCAQLAQLARAIRTRLLRTAIYAAGAPSGSVSNDHISAVEALVTSWHGQGAISLPGGVKVERISGRLSLSNQ